MLVNIFSESKNVHKIPDKPAFLQNPLFAAKTESIISSSPLQYQSKKKSPNLVEKIKHGIKFNLKI